MVKENNEWQKKERTEVDNLTNRIVKPFCVRTEGLFAAIEQWSDKETGLSFWRTISRNSVTSYYGKKSSSRIANPDNEGEIFEWLLEESTDEKGNRIVYSYEGNEDVVISVSIRDNISYVNKHISSIQYRNYFSENGDELSK